MLKLINGWTKETVMAQVKKFNDGTKAVNKENICVYRSPNGNRCAVGCFIPDGHEVLNVMMGARYLLKEFPDLVPFMPFGVSELCFFQSAHDQSYVGYNTYESIQNFLDRSVE